MRDCGMGQPLRQPLKRPMVPAEGSLTSAAETGMIMA
jgi:hypothetical protein